MTHTLPDRLQLGTIHSLVPLRSLVTPASKKWQRKTSHLKPRHPKGNQPHAKLNIARVGMNLRTHLGTRQDMPDCAGTRDNRDAMPRLLLRGSWRTATFLLHGPQRTKVHQLPTPQLPPHSQQTTVDLGAHMSTSLSEVVMHHSNVWAYKEAKTTRDKKQPGSTA